MSEADKIATIITYFPKPKGNIRINTDGEDPTPTKIAIFQDHLEQCAMAIPFDDSELGLAGLVMDEDKFKGMNQQWNKIHTTTKTKERQSFAPHAIKGFSVGPAMNRYRCFRIFIPDTGGTRISDTLRWFPHNDICMPIASKDILLRSAVQLLRKAIKDRLKNQILPPLEQDNHDTLTNLNELFQNRDKATKQKQMETPIFQSSKGAKERAEQSSKGAKSNTANK